MNSFAVHEMLTTPISMTVLGFLMVVLIALTLRAVVKRERAMMTRDLRHDSAARVAYVARWRNRSAA